jgi:hypothetical protein
MRWTSNSQRGKLPHSLKDLLMSLDLPSCVQLGVRLRALNLRLLTTTDNMSKMEDWQVTVLLAAKKHVEAKDTEDGDYFA